MSLRWIELAAVTTLLTAAAPGPKPVESVSALAWMSGTWVTQQDGAWTEEHWSEPRGGMIIGTSFSESKGRIEEFEFLRIATADDGSVTYWASPGGKAAVPFRLVSLSLKHVMFENPKHDYPTRIAYRRSGDRMTATIAGPDNASAQSWTYRRVR